jgi:hypothetical protein
MDDLYATAGPKVADQCQVSLQFFRRDYERAERLLFDQIHRHATEGKMVIYVAMAVDAGEGGDPQALGTEYYAEAVIGKKIARPRRAASPDEFRRQYIEQGGRGGAGRRYRPLRRDHPARRPQRDAPHSGDPGALRARQPAPQPDQHRREPQAARWHRLRPHPPPQPPPPLPGRRPTRQRLGNGWLNSEAMRPVRRRARSMPRKAASRAGFRLDADQSLCSS